MNLSRLRISLSRVETLYKLSFSFKPTAPSPPFSKTNNASIMVCDFLKLWPIINDKGKHLF